MIRNNTSTYGRRPSSPSTGEKKSGTQPTNRTFGVRTQGSSSITANSGSMHKRKNVQPTRYNNRPKPIVALNNTNSNTNTMSNSKNLRIIPIGGCEEVGRNMTVFEYDGDIVIIDMGIQFPEEDMPGIDYIIPNTKYLEDKLKNIRGVVFTHGHLDHIGAAPILLEKLGNPIIVGKDLTLALIKHKQDDYKKDTAKKLRTIRVNGLEDVVQLGKFTVKFFQVEHSIMDAVGIILETPNGTIIHPGDWTLARDRDGITHINYDELSKLPKPTILMLESLGALNDKRHGIYEEIYKNLSNLLENSPGRVVIGTFSSQLERVRWVIECAEKFGKKVALDGYSMKMNVKVAQELGYIKSAKNVLIDIKDTRNYPDNKVVVVCTGAQGEKNAVLMRIVSKQHRFIQLKKHDTVVFSSSIIPGNERSIQRLKDNMYRQCDNVIHGEIMDVHVSGHATREDILTMIDQIKPTYFIPVYANYYFLREAEQLALRNGFKKENIFVPDNGSIIEVNQEKAVMLDKKVPSDYVFVDGLGVSDNQNIVLRDRQVLAGDGMLVVIATIDSKTGTLIQNPDIISRGFVFLKDNKDLIEDIRSKVKQLVIKSDPKTWADSNQIRNDIRDKIGQFVLSKTEKRPMILPVIIDV